MVRGDVRRSPMRRLAVLGAAVLLGSVACTPGGSEDDAAPPTTARRTTSSAPAAPSSSSSAPVASSTTVPPPDLREADLTDQPYRVRCPGGEVELQPGVAAPGIDDRPVVVDAFEPQFLDLTGDGRPEAVVEVACTVVDEPATRSRSVVVLADDTGAVVQVGQPLDGADPTVVGGLLAVGREASVSTDASGSATSVVYEPFTFDGSTWVSSSEGSPVQVTDPVTLDGIGAVLVGAPFGEVAISSGRPIEAADRTGSGGACVEIVLPSGPEGVGGIGGDGLVQAVLVSNPAVRTAEGLGVGSTGVEVQFAFPGQVSVLPHERVPGGQHLIVDFPDQPDRVLLFNTDGTTVTDYAAGAAGWADVAEGCA